MKIHVRSIKEKLSAVADINATPPDELREIARESLHLEEWYFFRAKVLGDKAPRHEQFKERFDDV